MNEEKNISAENEAVEENNNSTPTAAPTKKLSGGVIGAIIGGVVAVIAVIILLVTLLGGNGGDGGGEGVTPDGKTTYTVTVVDQDGNPVKGAVIYFNPEGGVAFPIGTDSEGKVSYSTDKKMTVSVSAVPAGYEYNKLDEEQSFDKDGKLTVTVTKTVVDEDYFKILVVDQDGNPIEGVMVQMCADYCKMPVVTGADGKASYAYEEGDFHAQLTSLPEGYTVDDPNAYYEFVDGLATITLTKIAE